MLCIFFVVTLGKKSFTILTCYFRDYNNKSRQERKIVVELWAKKIPELGLALTDHLPRDLC